MKKLLCLLLMVVAVMLTACHDDDSVSVGKVWVYYGYEVSRLDDGAYIIKSKEEYRQVMGTPMPGDWNIDFGKTTLVIAKGTVNQGISGIKAEGNLGDDGEYIVNVTLTLNLTMPIETWGIAIVMPRSSSSDVTLNVSHVNASRPE
ncbi:MAG: hypothetical protein OSJ46_05980 [Duncaniella sp.]|nr:hypothetical protein [Duncaniella sp.]HBI58174.1 hypothetical protein [Porphyromonadaceae bacterium]